MTCGNRRRNLCHDIIVTGAATTLVCIFNLAYKQRHILCLQSKVGKHIVIDLLHHLRPVGVTTIRTALMKQDALDGTHLLCLLCHLYQTTIGIATIVIFRQRGPPLIRIGLQLCFILVLVEHLNRTATHSHSHHTYFHIGRQGCHHRASEIIGGTQFTHRTDDRTLGRVPLT